MTDILREHDYMTLRVFVSGNPQARNEEKVFDHPKTIKSDENATGQLRVARREGATCLSCTQCFRNEFKAAPGAFRRRKAST